MIIKARKRKKTTPEPQTTPIEIPKKRPFQVLKIFLVVLVIISGMAFGFFIGFFISFGACFKSKCHPLEEYAPVYLAFASLLITVPVSRLITK